VSTSEKKKMDLSMKEERGEGGREGGTEGGRTVSKGLTSLVRVTIPITLTNCPTSNARTSRREPAFREAGGRRQMSKRRVRAGGRGGGSCYRRGREGGRVSRSGRKEGDVEATGEDGREGGWFL